MDKILAIAGVAAAVGYVTNDLVRSLSARYHFWRIERDYTRACERMTECEHASVACARGLMARGCVVRVVCWYGQ